VYTVSVQAHYDAAHFLANYDGKCSRLHGHRYVIEAAVQSRDLDDSGIAFDFADLKGLLKELAGELDHQNLNELPQFADLETSAENQARYFYEALKERLPTHLAGGLVYTRVWESPSQWAQYSEAAWVVPPSAPGV
jgi:6-pyruvoyltetrahydropterin/6-carboxytetrahydropterin synthase